MKTVKISALSAAILLGGFASTSAWAADGETVVIGLAGPLTGPSARIGKDLENGAQLVSNAGQSMEDIVAQVQRVSDLIGEMSSATGEQTIGISQVGEAVMQLDQVTQQNAALVEQSSAASMSLKQQAASLVDAVSVFR